MAEKKNNHTIRYGNKDGEIKFGHIHDDQNVSAFMVRSGYNAKHYMTMDATGDVAQGRKNGTINRCPGVYAIKCGDDVQEGIPALYIEAVNGDIVLSANNGRIRLQADNIELLAEGADNKNGNIVMESNQKVEIRSNNIEINGTSVVNVYSSSKLELVADGVLNMFGSLMEAVEACARKNPSKSFGPLEIIQSLKNIL
jgi:hypothetical protein